MKAFQRTNFMSEWDRIAKTLICHIDRDCMKEIHGRNQAKWEYPLASNWDGTEIVRIENSSKGATRTHKTSK
jgi:hypothetical protein